MATYLLLYNDHCPTCRQLSQMIGEQARGRLTPLPLQRDQAVALLHEVYGDGWPFAPYLVRIRDNNISAWTGLHAASRLLWLLGPRATWQLLCRAHRAGFRLLPPLHRR